MAELQEHLPPCWESKLDIVSGRTYFINHKTKTTTWDDPRIRQRISSTPKHLSNTEQIPLQEFRNASRSSPLLLRGSKVQDSSLTVPVINSDQDEAVSKISAMFPTVSETHIRFLMKNCRYMKSIFPKADETVILEVLYNNENNIQKVSEILIEMGFQKKDTISIAQQKTDSKIEGKSNSEDVKNDETSQLPPHIKTAEEKTALQEQLKTKYKDVADHLITIALESVDYNENKANQILEIIVQENSNENDTNALTTENETLEAGLETSILSLPVSVSRQSIKSLLKSEKNDCEKNTHVISTDGSNLSLAQGPNSKYLLEDYVNWQGPNTNYRKGPQGLQKGPNRSLLGTKSYKAQGSNPELVKGPKLGLARGSIFSQLKSVTLGESRGK